MNYKITTRPKIPRNQYGYLTINSTGGGASSISTSTTVVNGGGGSDLKTYKIFGHEGNYAKGDIQGDLKDVATIYAEDAEISNSLNVGGDSNIDGNVEVGGEMSVSGDFDANNATITNTLKSNDIECDNVSCSDTISTHYLNSDSISNNNKITTKELDATTVKSTTINNADTITTKNIEVTGSAHFFELVIDKIKSAGGAALFTTADGFVIDKVTHITGIPYNRYRVFWKNTDDNGNYRANMWRRGDQALCMNFNQSTTGQSSDVSNKYYWCYVPWTSNDEALNHTDYDDNGYNFIDIVVDEGGDTTADGVVNPEIGDNIVMCGHRRYGNETQEEADKRGSAIYIASYAGLDSELKAPFIAQYRGIKTFDLTPYRKSYFDATGARFVGDFEITNDQMDAIAQKVGIQISQELGEIRAIAESASTTADTANTNATTALQTANGLLTRVTSTEQKLNGTEQSTLLDKITNVETTANGLTSTVSTIRKALHMNYLKGSSLNGHPNNSLKFETYGYAYNHLINGNVEGSLNGANAYRCHIPANVDEWTSDEGFRYNGLHWGCSKERENVELTVGNTYTVSCWVKPNVYVSSANPQRLHIEWFSHEKLYDDVRLTGTDTTTGLQLNGSHEAVITKGGWQFVSFEFTAVKRYNEFYFFVYNSWKMDIDHDVTITMPMVADEGVTEWSPNQYDINYVGGNMLTNTSTFKIGGNLKETIKDSIADFSEIVGTKYLRKDGATGSRYFDITNWTFSGVTSGRQIKPDTEYVFSFWANTWGDTSSELNIHMFFGGVDKSYEGGPSIGIGNMINNCTFYMDTNLGDNREWPIKRSDEYFGDGFSRIMLNPSNGWKRYFIHWKTAPDRLKVEQHHNDEYDKNWIFPFDVKVLIRLFNGMALIACPKLEEGCVPTDYTDRTDGFATPSEVTSEITQKANEISATVTENIDGRLKTTGVDITSGQILLNADNTVVNNNLSVGSLETRSEQATIVIKDGAMKVYGLNKTQPNIIFGVDDEGYAVLSYYDNNGGLLYNLGPQGIFNSFGNVDSKFLAAKTFLRADFNNTLLEEIVPNPATLTYYQFKEGYQWIASQKVKKYYISGTTTPSDYDEAYFSNTSTVSGTPTGTRLANGVYITNPQVLSSSGYAIQQSVNAVLIQNGLAINVFNLYYKFIANRDAWCLADTSYRLVGSMSISDYLTRTNQD